MSVYICAVCGNYRDADDGDSMPWYDTELVCGLCDRDAVIRIAEKVVETEGEEREKHIEAMIDMLSY